MKINEQYNTLDKHFNHSLQEKNISYNTLNDQYIKLFKEFNEYKTQIDKEKEEYNNKYNKLNNSNNSNNTNSNIKKCRSFKVNDMEKKNV